MNIFDLQFNTRQKKGLCWDSFCREDKNKERGSLFIVQELHCNEKTFLQNLTKIIKNKYYAPGPDNPEDALREALKEANQFLSQQSTKVNWFGNLHSIIMVVRGADVFFAKTGSSKILIFQNQGVADISQSAEKPRKNGEAFGSIACGQLPPNTPVSLLTPGLVNKIEEVGLLAEIAEVEDIDNETIEKLVKKYKKEVGSEPGLWTLFVMDHSVIIPRFSLPKIRKEAILVIFLALFLLIGGIMFRQDEKDQIRETSLLQELLDSNNIEWLIKEIKRGELNTQWHQQFDFRLKDLTHWQEINLISFLEAEDKKILTTDGNNIYLAGDSLIKIDLDKEEREEQKLPEKVISGNSNTFFAPGTIYYANGQKLTLPEYNLEYIGQYGNSFYFWKDNSIVRYNEGKLENWFSEDTHKPLVSGPATIDSWIWVIEKNSVLGYYKGNLEKELEIEIYPTEANWQKIISFQENLYLLDNQQGRVVVLTKEGELLNQYSNDLIIGADDMMILEEYIYILTQQQVYRLEL